MTEWLQALREHVPALRRYFQEWCAAVHEEPGLVWQTPAIRYATYGAGGLVLVWIAGSLAGMLAPPPPADARPEATTADFHVVCSAAECGHHFVVHRAFGFRAFPVACAKCDRKSGVRAKRCNSAECKGRWVAPLDRGGQERCPRCGKSFE